MSQFLIYRSLVKRFQRILRTVIAGKRSYRWFLIVNSHRKWGHVHRHRPTFGAIVRRRRRGESCRARVEARNICICSGGRRHENSISSGSYRSRWPVDLRSINREGNERDSLSPRATGARARCPELCSCPERRLLGPPRAAQAVADSTFHRDKLLSPSFTISHFPRSTLIRLVESPSCENHLHTHTSHTCVHALALTPSPECKFNFCHFACSR